MKPMGFEEQNAVYAKDQPEYLSLPVHKTPEGIVVSCWGLSFIERVRILWRGRLWFELHTFNGPLQPQRPSVDSPFSDGKYEPGE